MKKTIRTNHRLEVLVDPRDFRLVSEDRRDDAIRNTLHDIKRQIHRHVDDVDQVILKWDTSYECSHCGCGWEVLTEEDTKDPANLLDLHSIAGEPVCCDKAVEEFRTERGIPQSGCST